MDIRPAEQRHAGPDQVSLQSQWFASRIVSSAAIITRRLAYDGIHCYQTKFAPGIVFMRCASSYTSEILSKFLGKAYFYLNSGRKHPEPIPERQMNNFILATSVPDDLIPLGEVTPELLKGDRVRVNSGLFNGVEGVIKRIKGDLAL